MFLERERERSVYTCGKKDVRQRSVGGEIMCKCHVKMEIMGGSCFTGVDGTGQCAANKQMRPKAIMPTLEKEGSKKTTTTARGRRQRHWLCFLRRSASGADERQNRAKKANNQDGSVPKTGSKEEYAKAAKPCSRVGNELTLVWVWCGAQRARGSAQEEV